MKENSKLNNSFKRNIRHRPLISVVVCIVRQLNASITTVLISTFIKQTYFYGSIVLVSVYQQFCE